MPLIANAKLCDLCPTSQSLDDLVEPFRTGARRFVAELRRRGCTVEINATLRPPLRAWLMRQAWDLAKGRIALSAVPVHPELGAITWSVRGAREMVATYRLVHRPSLTSRHLEGLAVDMDIDGWTGTDEALHELGASFGVHKLLDDPPHWSSDGK